MVSSTRLRDVTAMATLPRTAPERRARARRVAGRAGRRHPASRSAAGTAAPGTSRSIHRRPDLASTARRIPGFLPARVPPGWSAKSAPAFSWCPRSVDGSACLGIRDRDLCRPGLRRLGVGLHHDAGRAHHLHRRLHHAPGRRPLRRQPGGRAALPLSRPDSAQGGHLLDRRHRRSPRASSANGPSRTGATGSASRMAMRRARSPCRWPTAFPSPGRGPSRFAPSRNGAGCS